MIVSEKTYFQRGILTLILVGIFIVSIITVSLVFLISHLKQDVGEEVNKRMNILFIVVDDLRPTLGCYGDTKAITPNIDQLASKSALFTNAYAQQALCAPSRTSFLTSRRPDSLHLYDTSSYWRKDIWNFTTLPEHFKNNGYETVSFGKIFHHGTVSGHTDDYPFSWSRKPYRPPTLDYKMDEVCPTPDGKAMNLVCPVDVKDQPGQSLPDLQVVDEAIKYLNNKSGDTPFLLGVGFYKPHIPFKFPQEYLDLYPIDVMDLAPDNTKPAGMPNVAWNPWQDLRERDDVKKLNASFPFGPLPQDFQKLIRQGYYASVSYMDDQLGKLLEALQKNGFTSNTAIVLLGDHGWSLGEHGEWSKYSNFDVSVRVPLLVYVPEITDELVGSANFKYIPTNESIATVRGYSAAHVAHEMVELVDIFPSLAEIANIGLPTICSLHSAHTNFCSEGVSFHPVLLDHANPSVAFSWKTAVFSQFPRPSGEPKENSDQPLLKDIRIMGYTIKDEDYRYTRWVNFNTTSFKPLWGLIQGHELYDLTFDPNETTNLADDPNHSNKVIAYFTRLKHGWRYELPPKIFGSYTMLE